MIYRSEEIAAVGAGEVLGTHLPSQVVRKWKSLVWTGRAALNWNPPRHWDSFDPSVKDEFTERTRSNFSPIWRVADTAWIPGFQVSQIRARSASSANQQNWHKLVFRRAGWKSCEKPEAVDSVLWTIINFLLMEDQSIYQSRANTASLASL